MRPGRGSCRSSGAEFEGRSNEPPDALRYRRPKAAAHDTIVPPSSFPSKSNDGRQSGRTLARVSTPPSGAPGGRAENSVHCRVDRLAANRPLAAQDKARRAPDGSLGNYPREVRLSGIVGSTGVPARRRRCVNLAAPSQSASLAIVARRRPVAGEGRDCERPLMTATAIPLRTFRGWRSLNPRRHEACGGPVRRSSPGDE